MKSLPDAFARFLKAEEVPRWFGLSLVLIYLVGLGTVANLGIRQARSEAAAVLEQSGRHAVRLLADRVAQIADEPDTSLRRSTYQNALRTFAANVPVEQLRVVEGRRVMASLVSAEVGIVEAAGDSSRMQDSEPRVRSSPGRTERVIRVGAGTVAADGEVEEAQPVFLEAVLRPEPVGTSHVADHAATLSIVLVLLGSLFVVYRCLREQLRSVSCIADRLQAHRTRLEEDLSALRIGDTLDTVTSAWNELVDLTQRLADTVQKTEADQELSRVLKSTSGGALAEALNAVPDGIIYISDGSRFEYINSAACRLLGTSAEQARRQTLSTLQGSGPGGKILGLLRAAQESDGGFVARLEVLETDEDAAAARSSFRVWLIPLPGPQHGRECVVMIRDVSQQLRAERAREEFVAQVTHELRTPLTNIRAYAETLSSGMFDDPKVVTECYNVITKETRRLSRLIEDILSVSQLEVGSIDLAIDQVDLKTLLTEAVRDVRGLADEKSIDLQLLLPTKLESLRGDRDKLAVVVNNLLANAIKYTPADGNVLVGCQQTADTVVITFKDNGIGIDPQDHARVFEKFQRGSDAAVQAEMGTGIGLYTAREIVRRHGGDISLVSEKGQGSTFLVRFPHRGSRATAMSAEPTERREAPVALPDGSAARPEGPEGRVRPAGAAASGPSTEGMGAAESGSVRVSRADGAFPSAERAPTAR